MPRLEHTWSDIGWRRGDRQVVPSFATNFGRDITAAERSLSALLREYVEYEDDWNRRFKAAQADGADRVSLDRLHTERREREQGLGVEAVMAGIDRLRQARQVFADLLEMAQTGASREEIATRAAATIPAAALRLADGLLNWVENGPSAELDLEIEDAWRQVTDA